MTLPEFWIIKAGEVTARCVEYLIGVVASSSRSGHGFTSAAADGIDSTPSRGRHACWSVASDSVSGTLGLVGLIIFHFRLVLILDSLC